MGMAASQARFLSLTARKSNTEYQGQQINQERTALANESSNIYAQLSKMDVPAPPNTSDFYKTVYNFSTKSLSEDKKQTQYTLEEIQSTPDGDVAYITHKTSYDSVSLVPKLTISMGSKDLTDEEKKSLGDEAQYITDYKISLPGGAQAKVFAQPANNMSDTVKLLGNETEDGNAEFNTAYVNQDGSVNNSSLYYYTIGNQKYFLLPSAIEKMKTEETVSSSALYVAQNQTSKKEEYPVTDYTQNDLGRYASITIITGYEKKVDADGKATDEDDKSKPITETFQLDCTKVEDEEAYKQAMMDYEYEYAKYQKQVSDLNDKTEEIQQKDKTLELELKQLDTEQNAIKTEMDAVTKVVEDNVESTFKTFG